MPADTDAPFYKCRYCSFCMPRYYRDRQGVVVSSWQKYKDHVDKNHGNRYGKKYHEYLNGKNMFIERGRG